LSSYVAEINSILDLAALVRGRRQALGLSQEELAERAKVSRQWISALEQGRPGAEMLLILRLLEALELRLFVDPLDPAPEENRSTVDLDALLEAHREPRGDDDRGR
jgi:HTH-type transcriptional regulator / antitoxin HipB